MTSTPFPGPDDLDFGATLRGFAGGQTVLKRYTLTRLLGRGGMGVVWLARDKLLNDDEVALKFLPESVVGDEVAVDELKREVLKSRKLTHPNIVRIHDFVSDGLCAAVAMEVVDGRTLGAMRLHLPARVFAVNALLPLVTQICGALDYAHQKAKVVHRDLKPANVMVTAEGEVKILDFGIAASISESASRVSNRGTSGTLTYMSPQQLLGKTATPADDFYALGATLYELLTSKPPFYQGAVETQVLNAMPDTLAARRIELGVSGEAVPAEWEATIAGLLAKGAAERPPSGAAVLAMLEGKAGPALAAEPSSENRTDETYKSHPPSKSYFKKPLVFAAVGIAALAFGGMGYYVKVVVPERARVADAARVEAAHVEAAAAAERSRQAELARLAEEKKLATTAAEKARIAAEEARLRNEKERAEAEELARVARVAQEKEEAERQAAAAREQKTRAEAAAAKLKSLGSMYAIPALGLDLIRIEPGTFTMGSPSGEMGRWDNERPHPVTITEPFYLGRTEVTQGQWQAIMGTTLREQAALANNTVIVGEGDNYPMYYVSWGEAKEFCRKVTARERAAGRLPAGYEYGLPSEAQWEYACRAGTTTAMIGGDLTSLERDSAMTRIGWYCGNSMTPNSSQTWSGSWDWKYAGETHKIEIDHGATHPVGQKQANAWGLQDMHGNVWEWCEDWYGDYRYGEVSNPTGAASGANRVNRGGGWYVPAAVCRSANRGWYVPGNRDGNLGFRLALSSVR